MATVAINTPVMAGTAAELLASAVALQSTIFAATPLTTAIVTPGADPVSATGVASFMANNAESLAMAQLHVAELVQAAQAVGDASIAYQVQDLVGKGLLLV